MTPETMIRLLNEESDRHVAFGNDFTELLLGAANMIEKYKTALADSIRRPMGVIPDSAYGLVDQFDLIRAEDRRPKTPQEIYYDNKTF